MICLHVDKKWSMVAWAETPDLLAYLMMNQRLSKILRYRHGGMEESSVDDSTP